MAGGLEGPLSSRQLVASGWDHAFASFAVCHGSAVVVGSGCLVGFFLPSLMGCFSALPMAPGAACHYTGALRPVPKVKGPSVGRDSTRKTPLRTPLEVQGRRERSSAEPITICVHELSVGRTVGPFPLSHSTPSPIRQCSYFTHQVLTWWAPKAKCAHRSD